VDNLTHSLFGWTIARTGLGRRVRYATPTLILASNAPDIDIVSGVRSGIDYLAAHRGPTHGPLGAIGLGLITAAIMTGWARLRSGRTAPSEAANHFLARWMLATIGIVCHVLMDLPTSYGTRMFSPFVWTWYALDWMPIIDLYLWAVLIVALAVGSRTRSQRAAFIALGFMAFDYSTRAVLHDRALANGAMFDAAGVRSVCESAPTFVAHSANGTPATTSDSCIEAAALPTFFSPLTWRIVRQHSRFYELSDRTIGAESAQVPAMRLENENSPDVLRVRQTRAGTVYFNFARFPIAHVSKSTPTLTTVRLFDARFIAMLSTREDAATNARLSVVVTLDESGRVVHQRFGD
jgi:membrane-bound metal-dependent hydrolase YbcI (DUF457 family)